MDTPTNLTPKIEFRAASNFRDEYANSVNLKVTTWDFQFTFGLMEQTSGDTYVVTNSSRVFISPQQAKALSQILDSNIEQYERNFGAITIAPPNLVQSPAGGKPQ